MNKKEAIEKIKALKPDEQCLHEYQPEEWEAFQDGFDDGKCYVELIIEQIDEPEKPVVPQFVADWYEENKDDFERKIFGLCLKFSTYRLDNPKLRAWFQNARNKGIQTLVNMHQFGYEVEKEKRYTAKLKLTDEYLVYYASIKDLHHAKTTDNVAKKEKVFHFTEDDLVKYHVWENTAYEVNEVR